MSLEKIMKQYQNITPDSLSPPNTPTFQRKSQLNHYLESQNGEKLNISLIDSYFERRNYVNPKFNETTERSSFLQQTSPLRNFLEPQRKFVVKQVRPVKPFYLDNKKDKSPQRSNSFMLSTISSENKQKINESEFYNKLHKNRRGRSESPIKRVVGQMEIPKNIPYANETINGSSLSIATTSKSSVGVSECSFSQSLSKIRSSEWSNSLHGLVEIIEICKRSTADLFYPHMMIINHRLIELLKSPRSYVCRTACQAAGHLFEHVKDTRRPEFDEIVDILLAKTADANKFIREDANVALDSMVTHIPTSHAIRALTNKGPEHRNHLVRTATARLMVCCVIITGAENILFGNTSNLTRRRIILSMLKFIQDKSLETRKFGQRLYKQLCINDELFYDVLRKHLEKEEVEILRKSI